MIWHRHEWVTVAQNYLAGRPLSNFKATGDGMALVERTAFGITTTTQRCTLCGKQFAYTVTGDGRVTREH